MNLSENFLFALAGFFLLVLILRELTCWYFKFSRMVELLEKIEERLFGIESNTHLLEKQSEFVNNVHVKEEKKADWEDVVSDKVNGGLKSILNKKIF